MNGSQVSILMYHSVSGGAGPTCIRPASFAAQMEALAEFGYQVLPLSGLAAWLNGGWGPPPNTVVLTFDDGYEDFATAAWPELKRRRWPATVFLPTGYVGRAADWDSHAAGRRVMDWITVAGLAKEGVEFGGHGVRHADLTALGAAEVRDEVTHCKWRIAEYTGRPTSCFAAPFGRTSPAVRDQIGRHYQLAAGTALARAGRDDDPLNLPRIEMWYFRNLDRWRAYLAGRSRTYFRLRQGLRWARSVLAERRPLAPAQ